jgi:hypothetical protein
MAKKLDDAINHISYMISYRTKVNIDLTTEDIDKLKYHIHNCITEILILTQFLPESLSFTEKNKLEYKMSYLKNDLYRLNANIDLRKTGFKFTLINLLQNTLLELKYFNAILREKGIKDSLKTEKTNLPLNSYDKDDEEGIFVENTKELDYDTKEYKDLQKTWAFSDAF